MSVEGIAGWVFADILLVLAIVGLGSAIPTDQPKPKPKPAVTAAPKVKPPTIIGMATQPSVVSISFDAVALVNTDGPEGRKVCAAIRGGAGALKGKRAALVLIFGGAPQVSPGQRVATAVGRQLQCADRALFPPNTPFRSFWDGSLPYGRARLEVFVYTTEQSATADH